MDSNKPPNGVYKNPRLMHVSTTIVGSTVQLQTKDGSVWEGIFSTFSPEFAICLDLTVKIDPKLKSQDCLFHALKNGSKAREKAFFELNDIVRITVNDVDLNYATKEMDKIVTDADISGYKPNRAGEHRELESWQDEDGGDADEALLSLDDVTNLNKNGGQNSRKTGWDPQEMFRYNERRYKVNSTYNDNLKDYTVALSKPNRSDKNWRQKQERAAALARDIESNPKSQSRLAKEDGSDDEEEKFSAVVRPSTPPQAPSQTHSQAPVQQSTQQSQTESQIQSQTHAKPQTQTQSQSQLQTQPQSQSQQQQQPQPQAQPQTQSQPQAQAQAQAQTQTQTQTQTQSQPRAVQTQIQQTPTPPPPQPYQPPQEPSPHSQSVRPPMPNTLPPSTSMPSMARRNFRPRYNPRSAIEPLKDFSKKLTIATKPTEDQSELVKKSKLNPNAKEFVYKPRSPASVQGANQSAVSVAPTVDLTNYNPMNQASHGAYYQQVPIFSHPPPHQQQPHYPAPPNQQQPHYPAPPPQQQPHYAAQFMPSYPHMHFQYMPSPMAPHFSPQQVPPRYIRGNFQNYHHRTAYPQTSAAVHPFNNIIGGLVPSNEWPDMGQMNFH